MTPKPFTLEHVLPALAYWQRRLRLQDWIVEVEIVHAAELGHGHDAECGYNHEQKHANIYLMDALHFHEKTMLPYHPEQALVHELLHLHFAPFDGKAETPEGTAQEQAINCISMALVPNHIVSWAGPY